MPSRTSLSHAAHQRVLSLDLNHADAARADLVEIPEIAERGNFDAGRARGLRMLVPSGARTLFPFIVSVTIFQSSLL